MKLARQQKNGAGGQKRVGDPGCPVEGRGQHLAHALAIGGLHGQIAQAIEHPPGHIAADANEGDQLDDALRGDGHHQAIVMLGGVDLARAEGHGETGEHDGHAHRDIGGGRLMQKRTPRIQRIEHRGERAGNGFQLQRDIRHSANHRDDRDEHRHLLGLAIAGGDEISDRGDVLRLGEPHDAQQQRVAQREDENGTEIDGQEIKTPEGGQPHRAEEGPGGAIDPQRQRIDQRSRTTDDDPPPPGLAKMSDGEQGAGIDQGGQYGGPSGDHCGSSVFQG